VSIRSELAAALKPLLPVKTKIIDTPRSIDGLEANKPVVMLYRETLAKAPNAQGSYFNTFALWIISPGIDPIRAENALDDLLDEVVVALDQISWLNWTTAERSVFGDNQAPAYKVNLTVIGNKE
jgi:hypothetical protein